MLTTFRFRFVAAALITLTLATPRAHAVSKEMVQLMTQVQQLQDAVARLQQSNDERMGVLKDLVQQTADSVNRMSASVGDLQKRVGVQSEAATAKNDQLSGQIQSLNDSLDEIKARMAKLDRALGDIQGQQQSINAQLQAMPASSLSGTPSSGPAPSSAPAPSEPLNSVPANTPAATPAPSRKLPPPGPSASVNEMYRGALGDYMSAKYTVATSEFNDIVRAYPDDNLSGNAYYYLGEINIHTNKPAQAIRDYDHLLERYPDNAKIPAAHLHKAEAMLALKQNEAGIRELRALVQRFPNSPEAAQARAKLSSLGAARR